MGFELPYLSVLNAMSCRKERYAQLINLEPIVLAKNFLSLNSVVGCRNDCVYCYKHSWNFLDKFVPHQIYSVSQIVDNLLNHPYYAENIPLAIHNSATDPFQKGVKNVTYEIMDSLENLGIKNIVALITKEYVSKKDIERIESFENIKPVLFVSYSGLPLNYERVVDDRRLKTMQNLKESNLKKILYYRPIIKGVNDDVNTIEKIIELGDEYFDAIVRSSIKLDVNTVLYMASKGITLDSSYDIGMNIHDSRKVLPEKSRSIVDEALKKSKIPVYKKTSCAVSYLYSKPDYHSQWIRSDIYCTNSCPASQKKLCNDSKNEAVDVIKLNKLLERMDKPLKFKVINSSIIVPGKEYSCSDIKFLRMATNHPVLAEIDGEFLTAEEQDMKYYNMDRVEVKKFLAEKIKILNLE